MQEVLLNATTSATLHPLNLMNQTFDLIIRNASVIDGSKAPRFHADIAIRADKIAAVGKLDGAGADSELDASGLVAAPGFIDAHTHDDRLLLSAPEMTPKLSQGVTTVVVGNCGISLAPLEWSSARGAMPPPLDLLDDGTWFRFPSFAAYLAELRSCPAAINAACLVGHSTLRIQTMDELERPANSKEIARMQELARAALQAGAVGISTGTYYPPAAAAPTQELIEVCRPLREHGGVFVTHMRDESEHVIDSLDETFLIGRTLGVPVVISHHKVAGIANFGRSKETLAHIARHLPQQPIGLDCYPYAASSTVLSADRLKSALRVLVTWSKPHPEFAGMELSTVAQRMGVSAEAAAQRLLPAGAIYFSMQEDDVRRILSFEETMIGSDGLPHDAFPHPRLWGTFPRVLGHYTREVGLFDLETAVHKMTGLPAAKFGLAGRGLLQPGFYADIVLFDAQQIQDRATFEQPRQNAAGVRDVFVNGRCAWNHAGATGARSGHVLSRA